MIEVKPDRPEANLCSGQISRLPKAKWIWKNLKEKAPVNCYTWFRKVIHLEQIPEDSTLYLAASSNARLILNGHVLRRKVARYHEHHITAERIHAGPYLKPGKNVLLCLHHNWGPVVTFQRTGNQQACLYVNASWVQSGADWKWKEADEFIRHEQQIVGVNGHSRIRFPLLIDGQHSSLEDWWSPDFDDSQWAEAVEVQDDALPEYPSEVETPGQREYPVRPISVLNAGRLEKQPDLKDDAPLSISENMVQASLQPCPEVGEIAGNFIRRKPVRLEGRAGQSFYITFDFALPVHGYPYVKLLEADAGIVLDLGYGEIPYSLYDGSAHVTRDGWVQVEGVVGKGYADRYRVRGGSQDMEIPDERTARWLVLHIHFTRDGALTFQEVGLVKSQYPIQPVGFFECGNEKVHQIIRLCQIHAEVSMTDTYVDTPGREDGQWIEDARPRAVIASRWFGDNALRRLLIRTVAESQFPDGHLHPFPPSNFPVGPASFDWSVQWVGCLYDEYIWTGETDLLKKYWSHLEKYWENVLALVNEEGLWQTSHVLGDLRVGVFPTAPNQSSGIVSPWMMRCLLFSVEMARAVGRDDKAQFWQKTADRFAKAFCKYHVEPARGDIPAHVANVYDPEGKIEDRGYSQSGQTKALYCGLMDQEQAVKNLDYAFPEPDCTPPEGVCRWNNPTNFYRVLKVLSMYGMTRRAVRHLIERFEPYLPSHPRNPVAQEIQGPYGGPLPEYWISREDMGLKEGEINSTQPEDVTGSHGWCSSPLLWFHEYLLGVRFLSPGGRRILVAPEDGGLPYVAGRTQTPRGSVYVYWDPGQWRLEVEIPAEVEAELLLPEQCRGKAIRILHSAGPLQELKGKGFLLTCGGTYRLQAC